MYHMEFNSSIRVWFQRQNKIEIIKKSRNALIRSKKLQKEQNLKYIIRSYKT